MPDKKLVQRVVNETRRLAEDAPSGEVEGKEVAEALDMDSKNVDLHYAFKVAERRGRIQVGHWEGSMGLPTMITVD